MLILAQLLPPEPIGHGYSIVIYKDKVIITHASRHDIFIPLYACEWYAHDQNVFVMAVTDYAQPGFLIVHQLDMPTGKMAVGSLSNTRHDIHNYLQSVVPGASQKSISGIGLPHIPILHIIASLYIAGFIAVFIILVVRKKRRQKMVGLYPR